MGKNKGLFWVYFSIIRVISKIDPDKAHAEKPGIDTTRKHPIW